MGDRLISTRFRCKSCDNVWEEDGECEYATCPACEKPTGYFPSDRLENEEHHKDCRSDGWDWWCVPSCPVIQELQRIEAEKKK